jgi:Tol biopolymer transport system component
MIDRSEDGDPPEPLAPGSEISHYRIIGQIGSGGMGIVYRARDLLHPRDVALKRPRPELSDDPRIRKRFLREARAASVILHPHVVPVFEVFEAAGTDWIAMELVEGETLKRRLERSGALPVDEILRHAEGLADALRAGQAKGVLHRDVNPKNILVDADGKARLMDFGLAKRFVVPGEGDANGEASTSTSLTDKGQIVGTPLYMSPEQALGRATDGRSDIYGLGAVLYEMCTGQSVFPPGPAGDLLDAILHRQPSPISRANYAIPEELERIVRKCLAKRADERYQDARELLADVRALRRASSADALAVAPPRPWWSRPAALAAAGAVIVVAAIAVAWIRARTGAAALSLPASRQVTAAPGWETDPALSPDGTLIAYVSDESGQPDLWVIDARGGNALRLTDDAAADRNPAWMPDGSAVIFESERSGRAAIWRVPRLGGAATLVLPHGCDPAISRDGRTIAYADNPPGGALRIAVAPLQRPDEARFLTADDTGLWSHRHPAFSPDGRTICYSDERDLWLVPVEGGKRRHLTTHGVVDVEPAWSPDGRWVYFASVRSGSLALWRVAAAGGEPTRLTLGNGPERRPSVSSDGSRLVYSTFVNDPDLVLVDLRSGARHRLSALGTEINPALAPDGSALAFVSYRWAAIALWTQHLRDGKPDGLPRRLTDQPGSAANPAYSPDGRWLAYHRVVEGQRDIWIVPSEGGESVPFTADPAVDIQPAWSPDGGQIAFVSERGGTPQIWAQPVAGGRAAGPARQITQGEWSAQGPAWSADGKRLAFVASFDDKSEVYVVNADGTETRAVTHGATAFRVRWESDRMLLVSGMFDGRALTLRRVPVSGGEGQPLDPPIEFGSMARYGVFDVTPDGKLLVFTREEVRGDLWIMESKPGTF